MSLTRAIKPLGGKCYGSICHLPGSRLGPGDHKITPGQARILTERTRDKADLVIVQEKLDGSNVGVARVNGELIPLIRAGYPAVASHYEQHRLFAAWVYERLAQFEFIQEGERLCGEWIAQAHGTRYAIIDGPFIAFDMMKGDKRFTFRRFTDRLNEARPMIPSARVIHRDFAPCSIQRAMLSLNTYGYHGAQEPVEGAVWRVERDGAVDFLAKYVRPNKVDGKYLVNRETGEQLPPVWNWRPGGAA